MSQDDDRIRYPGLIPDSVDPDSRAILEQVGLPVSVLTIFQAVESPYVATCEDLEYRAECLVIGFSREEDELCVDLKDGQVLLLAAWNPSSPLRVNRGIREFSESLDFISAMVPFYGPDRDLDIAGDAEARIRAGLERIDGVSTSEPNGFWRSFLDDLGVGDYPG